MAASAVQATVSSLSLQAGPEKAEPEKLRRSERPWDVGDLTRCYKIYERMEANNSRDPLKHLYIGLALQMAGQPDSAKRSLHAFCIEALARYGDDLNQALEHYKAAEKSAVDLDSKSDFEDAQQTLLDYNEALQERAQRKRGCGCTVM